MESLGPFLKQGREEAGISLEQLAERTRIRRESLEFLEKEDLDNLPTDPYVRGFVKLVCRELGLAPRDGLVRYETLRARLGPQDEITWSEERRIRSSGRLQRALEDPERVVLRARRLMRGGALIGAAVVAVLLAWGGASLVKRAGQPPALEVASETPPPSPSDEAPAAPANDAVKRKSLKLPLPLEEVRLAKTGPPRRLVPERILVTVRPARSASVDVEPAADPAVPPLELPAAVEVTPAAEEKVARATPATPAREQPVVQAAPAQGKPVVQTAPALSASGPGERLRLEVQAIRAVEVNVLLDGVGYPRTARLVAGEWKAWKADTLFSLSATDGGAIRIRLSGVDLGSPGRDGEALDRLVLRRP